jgi:hypothetical protein
MREDFVEFLDSQEVNPTFCHELKTIVKKEPSFERIYIETVKAFCLNVFGKGLQAATELASFKGIISKAVCLSNTPEYELIKFRAKIPGKGSSKSPRICVAVVRVNDSIIPLAAYTHGDTKGEPEFNVLLERLVNILKVWKRHQQSSEE